MSIKKTIILLIVAIAVVVFYQMDREKVAEQKEREEQEQQFIQADSGDIMELVVQHGEQKIRARRSDDTWEILEPVNWPGDRFAWDSIADTLSAAKINFSLPDEGETLSDTQLSSWGLKPAGLQLTAVVREGSETIQLGFGKNPPGGTGLVYATNAQRSDKVFVINNSVVTNASKDLNDLRDRRLMAVSFDEDAVSRVAVSNQHLSFVAEKGANDQWFLKEPVAGRANLDKIKKIVEKLGTQATRILDNQTAEQVASAGLADPMLPSATRYQIFMGPERASLTFYVGEFDLQQGSYLGRREGLDNLFVLPKEFFTDQPEDLSALRPEKVCQIPAYQAEIIAATEQDGPLYSFEKVDFNWQMTMPRSATPERDRVEGLMRSFNDHLISRFAEPQLTDEEMGLDNPRLVLTVKGSDSQETVLFGNTVSGNQVYAAWQGAPDRFVVPERLLDALYKDPYSFLPADQRPTPTLVPPPPVDTPPVLDLTKEEAPVGDATPVLEVSNAPVIEPVVEEANLAPPEKVEQATPVVEIKPNLPASPVQIEAASPVYSATVE